jgi:hypothetical protein
MNSVHFYLNTIDLQSLAIDNEWEALIHSRGMVAELNECCRN